MYFVTSSAGVAGYDTVCCLRCSLIFLLLVSCTTSSSFSHPSHWVALVSPLLVFLLLTQVSGIPLLEKMADQKFGDDAQYKAYKASVPVLVPFLGRAGDAKF